MNACLYISAAPKKQTKKKTPEKDKYRSQNCNSWEDEKYKLWKSSWMFSWYDECIMSCKSVQIHFSLPYMNVIWQSSRK